MNKTLLVLLLGFGCLAVITAIQTYNAAVKPHHLVTAIGTTNLLAYSRSTQQTATWSNLQGPLPKELWHPAFAKSGVIRVQHYMTGMQIVLAQSGRKESGIYVPMDTEDTPNDGSGTAFNKVADGVFLYEEKIRVAYTQRRPPTESLEQVGGPGENNQAPTDTTNRPPP